MTYDWMKMCTSRRRQSWKATTPIESHHLLCDANWLAELFSFGDDLQQNNENKILWQMTLFLCNILLLKHVY